MLVYSAVAHVVSMVCMCGLVVVVHMSSSQSFHVFWEHSHVVQCPDSVDDPVCVAMPVRYIVVPANVIS